MRALSSTLLGFALVLSGCSEGAPAPAPTPTQATETRTTPWPAEPGGPHQQWTVRVIDRIPHDESAFTQGLESSDEGLIEGTGRRGESRIRLVDPATGAVIRERELDAAYFGEGVTLVGDEIVQLTWTAGVALRYDAATLEPVGEFSYEGAGWGICATADDLWMSNGSADLTRRDPATFEPLATVTVQRDGVAVAQLNELECIDELVVANVWKSDEIVVIAPTSGEVVATIDAGELVAEIGATDDTAVLNGIADLGDGTLLLGGKLWPTFFIVEVVEVVTPES